ncbi:hypothetical protein C2W62_42230 [Candidatus Entotheonella serta]|nr:hypothetical protein C2W62_42230 [Candidatus Entotheonella serta]
MTTVAEALIELFAEAGVQYVFGVPSGPWVPYMEAMRTGLVEFVLVSNEASAGFMADVCGRLTGRPGACYGTFGPGATNLSTGVGGALLDRSPLLAFTTEPPAAMQHRTLQMAIDHQALFRPLTKWTTRAAPSHLHRQKCRDRCMWAYRQTLAMRWSRGRRVRRPCLLACRLPHPRQSGLKRLTPCCAVPSDPYSLRGCRVRGWRIGWRGNRWLRVTNCQWCCHQWPKGC